MMMLISILHLLLLAHRRLSRTFAGQLFLHHAGVAFCWFGLLILLMLTLTTPS